MNDALRCALTFWLAAGAALGACAPPPPPRARATSPRAARPATRPAVRRPPAPRRKPPCLPAVWHKQASDAYVIGARVPRPGVVDYCLSHHTDGKSDLRCFQRALATGRLTRRLVTAAERRREPAKGPSPWKGAQLTLCRGTPRTCVSFAVPELAVDTQGSTWARRVFTVSPDGKRLFVAGKRAKGSTWLGVFFDLTRRRKLRTVAFSMGDEVVTRARWLGSLVLAVSCVEAGPGCRAWLVKPSRGAPLDTKIYPADIDPACFTAGPDRWTCADGTNITLLDTRAGRVLKQVRTPRLHGEPNNPPHPLLLPGGDLLLVGSGSEAGCLYRHHPKTGRLIKEWVHPTCQATP